MIKFSSISVEGFRAFGPRQILDVGPSLTIIKGDNSKGKTSLAEAVEFLLSGQTSRRDVVATTKTEFARGLRNVHYAGPVYVEAEMQINTGTVTIRRTLKEDYPDGVASSCTSVLEILKEDQSWSPFKFEDHGMPVFNEPIRLPIIFQHTLRYVSNAKPGERRDYFKRLLDVEDLANHREAVRLAIQTVAEPGPAESLALRLRALAQEVQFQALVPLTKAPLPSQAQIDKAICAQMVDLLPAENRPSDHSDGKAVAEAFKSYLPRHRRQLTQLTPTTLGTSIPPLTGDDSLSLSETASVKHRIQIAHDTYQEHHEVVEEQLSVLFPFLHAGVNLPQFVGDFEMALDCPFCLSTRVVTQSRIENIRQILASPERIKKAQEATITILVNLQQESASALARVLRLVPSALADVDRQKLRGFVGTQTGRFDAWDEAHRKLIQSKAHLVQELEALQKSCAEALQAVRDGQEFAIAILTTALDNIPKLLRGFITDCDVYKSTEEKLSSLVDDAVNLTMGISKQEDLLGLWHDRLGIRDSLVEFLARETVNKRLQVALKEITDANAAVLIEDKFPSLNDDISRIWNQLRPEEPVNFGGVKPKGKGLREIDIKATLLNEADLVATQSEERDAVAVFSDSQLNCLGLALFLARASREPGGFVILDDPIQSLDEAHANNLATVVLRDLMTTFKLQIILLTHDKSFWRLLQSAFEHTAPNMLRVSKDKYGAVIERSDSKLVELLRWLDAHCELEDEEVFDNCSNRVRMAGEVLSKEILVLGSKDTPKQVTIDDLKNKEFSELLKRVQPFVSGNQLAILRQASTVGSPGSHDDEKYTRNAQLKRLVDQIRDVARSKGIVK